MIGELRAHPRSTLTDQTVRMLIQTIAPYCRSYPSGLFVLGLAVLLLSAVTGEEPSFSRVTGVTLPVLDPDSHERRASVRIRTLERTHQRKGFFRIGVLPLWRLEAVEIELLDPGAFQDFLEGPIPPFLDVEPSSAVEIHSLHVRLSGEALPWLEVGICRWVDHDRWQLSDVLVRDEQGECLRLGSAALRLQEGDAGWVLQGPDGVRIPSTDFPTIAAKP